MRPSSEHHVPAAECDHLGDPQARLEHEEQEGVVAPPRPSRPVGAPKERLDLLEREERDDCLLESLLGDGEHTLDDGRRGRLPKGGEAEQGVNRHEARVAGADAVPPVLLEMLEERPDERGVEVGELETAGGFSGALLGKGEQQTERCRGRRRPCAGSPPAGP